MARTTIRTEDITASEVTTAKMATDPTNASNLSSGSVPLAQLGNVDTSGIIANQDDIALLGFKVASNGSLAKYNLVDQTVDDFQDTSGVNAGSSTDEIRDSSGKYYWGAIPQTATQDADDSGVDGDYTWYKWTDTASTGSYSYSATANHTWLVVAGGGGGNTAGGGAGGYRAGTSLSLTGGNTYTATVGAGGAGGYTTRQDGNNSILSGTGITTITSTGGGYGGYEDSSTSGGPNGSAGGSGGGEGFGRGTGSAGAGNTPSITPITGETTTVQGYAGGIGYSDLSTYTGGGGGGGAYEVGGSSVTSTAGSGGDGVANSITGSSVTYAGGGGGGIGSAGTPGTGGAGGGGDGANTATNPGTDGLGGGGGGQSGSTAGAGGSGVVILRRATGAGGTYNNMTLISTTTAAQAAPTKGDIVFTYTNGAGSTTLGTDVTAEISADGGSTWTAMTLGSEGSTGSHNIATAHDVTITSTITSPWNMAYRIKTLNQTSSKTTRIQAVSLGWS